MEWIFFGVFSIFAAILYNFIAPKIAQTQLGQSTSAKGYIGQTLVTAVAFFVVLAAASLLMSIVVGKRAAELPTA